MSVPGWSRPGEYDALAFWAAQCPGPWVEIGSYCGASAVVLGEAARDAGTVLFAVDPHRGNPEMRPGQECHHPEVWAREHGSLSVLIDTIRDHDLEGIVIPVVGSSAAFALTEVWPGFVFIDGDHSEDAALADWATWSDLMVNGVVAIHDAEHSGPAAAVAAAIAAGWKLVDSVESLRVLARGTFP